jgi:predicted Fe-Mo cluster-binding NifX family protein
MLDVRALAVSRKLLAGVAIVLVLLFAALFLTGVINFGGENKTVSAIEDMSYYCPIRLNLIIPGVLAVGADSASIESVVSLESENSKFFMINGLSSGREFVANQFSGKEGAIANVVGVLKARGVETVALSGPSQDFIRELKKNNIKCFNVGGLIYKRLNEVPASPVPVVVEYCQTIKNSMIDLNKLNSLVAVAADSASESSIISLEGAASPFFMIYDQNNGSVEFIQNTAMASASKDADVVSLLKEKGVGTVISSGAGESFLKALEGAGFKCINSGGLISKLKR